VKPSTRSNLAELKKSPYIHLGQSLAASLVCALALSLSLNSSAYAQSDTVANPDRALTGVSPSASEQSQSETKTQEQKTASIKGLVLSIDGKRPVADAEIVLTRAGADHERLETQSDKQGAFSFNNLPAGQWHITTSHREMLSHTTALTLASGENKDLKIDLEDLEPVDVMRITGKRTLIHPEKIGSETNLDHRFIQEYRSGNNLRELIESTPGVMNDSYGNIITRGEHNAINYEVDGVVIPESAGALQQSQPISPRSLQSAQIDIGGYEAQDGGGPLGAVAHLKTLPIIAKPNFTIGQQIGGPLAGSIYYNGSGAFSQDPASKLHKLRFESSGSFRGSSIRIAAPTQSFANNRGADINVFARLEYLLSPYDKLKASVAINESFLGVPTSHFSNLYGVRQRQQDRQDYFILSYQHKFRKFFDEFNLHLLNGFYSESFRSSNAFDPAPNINADQPLYSMSAQAKRFNYIFSAQGDLTKTLHKTHHLKTGFLSEVRPVKTKFQSVYYNSDLSGTLAAQADAQAQIAALTEAGDLDGASQINTNPLPYGAVISPFTLQVAGPQMQGSTGNYRGFRYLQSAFFQDRWKPEKGFWRRLTLDAGVRFDLQHSVFGNARELAATLSQAPGVEPFSLKPFETQRTTGAQASGRYGASIVLTKNSVLRGSYSDIFTPTPVDYFLGPININDPIVNGIYAGTPRPLLPTRGKLVDVSIESQFGPRFVTRTNLFYKKLYNFGDSGVIGNLPIYNRLTNSAQEAYGVETRVDLKPAKNGYGFNGFLSNTVQVAYLRGSHGVSGGFYDFPATPLPRYPDHDRRYQGTAGLGYRSRQNWWVLGDVQVLTGLQNYIDREVFGPHHNRTPLLTVLGFSGGYQTPQKLHQKYKYLPASFDVRVENMLNQRLLANAGSPFQGTRYTLPCRVLAGFSWNVGRDNSKLVAKPAAGRAI
jgi:hypothetical protein